MFALPILAFLQLIGCTPKPDDKVAGFKCENTTTGKNVDEITGVYQGSTTDNPIKHIVKVGESEYQCDNAQNLAWNSLLSGCNNEYMY